MGILTVLLYVYLAIGGVYGLYLLFTGNSSIWGLPINILGGPIVIIYHIYSVVKYGPLRDR